MSDTVEATAEATSDVSSSEPTNELKTKLQQSHALQTGGDWKRGRVENIRIRPQLKIYGSAYDRDEVGYSITTHGKSGSISTTRPKTSLPKKEEAPFIERERHNRNIPHDKTYLQNIEQDTIKVEEFADLYLLGGNEEVIGLIPFSGKHSMDGYLVTDVVYEVVGELNSDELLQPHMVKLFVSEFLDAVLDNELFGNDSILVKYKYHNDSLSIRYQKDKSLNLITPKRFDYLFGGPAIVGLFYSLLEADAIVDAWLTSISVSGVLHALLSSMVVGVGGYGAYTGIRKTHRYMKKKVTTGDTISRVDSVDEAPCLDFERVETIHTKSQEMKRKAEELRRKVRQLPREVTVTPTEDMSKLHACNTSLTWRLSNGAVLEEESLEFFTEYGFEQDVSEITTHMVKEKDAVPDHMPALESTNGDWYLLPEKMNYDPIITIRENS